MGYYSNFSLVVCHRDQDEIIADLRNNNECAHKALDESGNTNDQTKWYDMDKDMKEFSKKYPEVLLKWNDMVKVVAMTNVTTTSETVKNRSVGLN